jgi:hypothetical protein
MDLIRPMLKLSSPPDPHLNPIGFSKSDSLKSNLAPMAEPYAISSLQF